MPPELGCTHTDTSVCPSDGILATSYRRKSQWCVTDELAPEWGKFI